MKKIITTFKEFEEDLVLLIPDEIAESLDLTEGSDVDVTVKDGEMIIRKVTPLLSFAELKKFKTPKNS